MADERTYPCLPCPEIDDSIAFYESLGFRRTYRQVRPNPYAVVIRNNLQVHLFGIDSFDPAKSSGSAIVAVPDPDALYAALPQGLRQRSREASGRRHSQMAGPGNATAPFAASASSIRVATGFACRSWETSRTIRRRRRRRPSLRSSKLPHGWAIHTTTSPVRCKP